MPQSMLYYFLVGFLGSILTNTIAPEIATSKARITVEDNSISHAVIVTTISAPIHRPLEVMRSSYGS